MYEEPELRHLRAFVVAAEELHFTRAAQRLHLTQQALSSQIRQLEEVLGVRLFERTTRKVELTDAGYMLLVHAKRLLEAASCAWEEVLRADAGQLSTVRVAYAPTARFKIMPELLEAVHARHPGLTVQAVESWRKNAGVADEAIDVAIARFMGPVGPDVEVLPLGSTRLGVILAADHPLASDSAVMVERLRGATLMHMPRAFAPNFYDHILSSLQAQNWTGPIAEFEIMSGDALMGNPDALARIASKEAFGVGFEDQYPGLSPDFVWLSMEPELLIPINICWHRGASAAVRNVVAIALELHGAAQVGVLD